MYTVRICLEFKCLKVKKDTFNVNIVEIISSLFVHNFFVQKRIDNPISVTPHLFILMSYIVLDLKVINDQS